MAVGAQFTTQGRHGTITRDSPLQRSSAAPREAARSLLLGVRQEWRLGVHDRAARRWISHGAGHCGACTSTVPRASDERSSEQGETTMNMWRASKIVAEMILVWLHDGQRTA